MPILELSKTNHPSFPPHRPPSCLQTFVMTFFPLMLFLDKASLLFFVSLSFDMPLSMTKSELARRSQKWATSLGMMYLTRKTSRTTSHPVHRKRARRSPTMCTTADQQVYSQWFVTSSFFYTYFNQLGVQQCHKSSFSLGASTKASRLSQRPLLHGNMLCPIRQ